jgi:hydrogenase maturation protease
MDKVKCSLDSIRFMTNPKTLILGLGNPILSDDGVGLIVAEELRGRVDGVDVISTPLIGLHLLDLVLGYDTLFLIDALITAGNQPGQLKFISPNDISLPTLSSHGFNFLELLMLGKKLGFSVPELKGVYGITIGTEPAFGETPSPGLMRNVEAMASQIARHIREQLSRLNSLRLCGSRES